ncbi:betaine/proline/choline family ABC transporter ATP-binding protein [Lentibacillus cibarius]|uniref:Quaternary amine transport ATP-binding protein n=1 Tax=Lentibacillus cibarius TaxID=2583219 RepID=A0A5S3R7D3_9BACI|nr:betaine/proline/choline family ABC transporter ATP-binding protein [Lentibacillus cibarius]TMN21633.1 betaine/proline/choline family ABC transporter ATP-binding protein [Lentibacillus cibarius]
MIELKNIEKVYEDGFQALKNIDLAFEDGKINVLIGPSGCGKTTTMKLLNRLVDYTGGEILLDGTNIKDVNPIELRRHMGFVIQNIGLFPHMTIYNNVAAVPKLLKWPKETIKDRVIELLELVNLDPQTYMNRYPSELSGGQQQRIGVIRALAAEPSIILMDEPFSALDPISREQLQDELLRLQTEINKTIIFVTHDMDEALKIADQIILMKDGQIVQKGSPKEIIANPADDFVKDFIGEKRLAAEQKLPSLDTFISESFVSIQKDSSTAEAIEQMTAHKVTDIPVETKEGIYYGSINLYHALANKDKQLSDLIDSDTYTVENGMETEQVVKQLNGVYTTTPVIATDGQLVGMLDPYKLLHEWHVMSETERGDQ